MTVDELIAHIGAMEGVVIDVASAASGAPEVAWGDVFCFHQKSVDAPRDHRSMFATIVMHDYPGFDEASNLSRDGAFRLNVAVGAATFERLIGRRPGAAKSSTADTDFAAGDRVLPHPVYSAQAWVSIVNPGRATHDLALEILSIAHARVRGRHDSALARRRVPKSPPAR